MAGRFVRCEWLVGRGVGVPRGLASGFCVSSSPVRDSLESGGPADSRAPVAETPNDGRSAVWRAADTETAPWGLGGCVGARTSRAPRVTRFCTDFCHNIDFGVF